MISYPTEVAPSMLNKHINIYIYQYINIYIFIYFLFFFAVIQCGSTEMCISKAAHLTDTHFSAPTLHNCRKKKYIYIYTYTYSESIQTPLHFSLFVILQPFAKII